MPFFVDLFRFPSASSCQMLHNALLGHDVPNDFLEEIVKKDVLENALRSHQPNSLRLGRILVKSVIAEDRDDLLETIMPISLDLVVDFDDDHGFTLLHFALYRSAWKCAAILFTMQSLFQDPLLTSPLYMTYWSLPSQLSFWRLLALEEEPISSLIRSHAVVLVLVLTKLGWSQIADLPFVEEIVANAAHCLGRSDLIQGFSEGRLLDQLANSEGMILRMELDMRSAIKMKSVGLLVAISDYLPYRDGHVSDRLHRLLSFACDSDAVDCFAFLLFQYYAVKIPAPERMDSIKEWLQAHDREDLIDRFDRLIEDVASDTDDEL